MIDVGIRYGAHCGEFSQLRSSGKVVGVMGVEDHFVSWRKVLETYSLWTCPVPTLNELPFYVFQDVVVRDGVHPVTHGCIDGWWVIVKFSCRWAMSIN